jgi:predicted transcriptional regulator
MATLTIELPKASLAKLAAKAKAAGEAPAVLARHAVEQSLKSEDVSAAAKLRPIRGILHTRAGGRNGTRGYLKGFGR